MDTDVVPARLNVRSGPNASWLDAGLGFDYARPDEKPDCRCREWLSANGC